MKLRRLRRRNRIPHGLLVSVSAVCAVAVVAAMFAMSLLALPASAKNGMRMPRTEDGIVTDGDGIIESGDVLPEGSDLVPDGSESSPMGDGSANGESIVPDVSESGSGAMTTDTARPSQSTDQTTTGMIDDVVEESNAIAWVIALAILAAVVIAVILIIRWASGSRRS